MKDTGLVTICRCGWVLVSSNYEAAHTEFATHKAESEGYHDTYKFLAVGLPLTADGLKAFKRIATVVAADSKALDFISRCAGPRIPRVVVPTKRWNLWGRLCDWLFSDVAEIHYGGHEANVDAAGER